MVGTFIYWTVGAYTPLPITAALGQHWTVFHPMVFIILSLTSRTARRMDQ